MSEVTYSNTATRGKYKVKISLTGEEEAVKAFIKDLEMIGKVKK